MFVLSKSPTFKYEVSVKQARESGKLESFAFTAEFRRFNQEEIRQISAEAGNDRALLDKVWVGWSGVQTLVDEGGVQVAKELPVTAENREALLREPGVEVALVRAWLEATVFGPAKN